MVVESMEDNMNHVVSPFLEEIIQYIDATLCDDNKEFAELPRDLRVYAALALLSKAGIATQITKAGQDYSWEPTTSFLSADIQRKPDFAPLVIAGFESVPDDVVQLSIKYARACAGFLREADAFLRSVRAGFENYALGLVAWKRRSDGNLVWKVTKRGRKVLGQGFPVGTS
jgi:hypothetical protein